MTVKMSTIFLDIGVPCIGLVSVVLFALSFFVGAGDAMVLRSAAKIGVLSYAAFLLARFVDRKEKEKTHGEA